MPDPGASENDEDLAAPDLKVEVLLDDSFAVADGDAAHLDDDRGRAHTLQHVRQHGEEGVDDDDHEDARNDRARGRVADGARPLLRLHAAQASEARDDRAEDDRLERAHENVGDADGAR